MHREIITSAQNPKVKRLLALQEKSRLRRESGLFVAEGTREVARAVAAGFKADTVFVCPEICGGAPLARESTAWLDDCAVVEVPAWLYDKMAYRSGTQGIIAELRSRELGLEELHLGENPLVMVLESVEKPGNLGAVLRSADAAGADALIVCDPLTDLYNPNVIRASTGAVFSMPTACCDSAQAISYLHYRGIRILTAQLQDSSLYYDCDMRGAVAVVVGSESQGLSQAWRDASDGRIRIPMMGACDSLNASVSASILLYEALRQRLRCAP